jgi:1,4-alpha-glucan branching enzyme
MEKKDKITEESAKTSNQKTKVKSKKTVQKKKTARKDCAPRKRVTLSVQADPGSTVFVAGSFNDWNPTGKKLVDKHSDGTYKATILLAPGIYEYKFIINGIWTLDPDPDRDWTQNGLGTLNSVLRVG